MRIDSHQHFWNYDSSQYPWIPTGSALHRDWLPGNLAKRLQEHQFDGSIAVQARQSIEETRWLLELSESTQQILGVVGWVDLRSSALVAELDALSLHPRLVGVRHVAQDEPDDDFLTRPDVILGISRLRSFHLVYDLLVFPHQLPSAIRLAQSLPGQQFVLDHGAKPPIRLGDMFQWKRRIHQLSKCPNVSCKISGLVTEADLASWSCEQIFPYIQELMDAFGEDRILFGSDWPVCLLAASYDRVVDLAERAVSGFSTEAKTKFWGGNAEKVYLRSRDPIQNL